MTFNSDGNMLGRVGALVVIGLTLWGVHRINCGSGHCPVMVKPSAGCCSGEPESSQSSKSDAPAPAAPHAEH